MDKTIVPKEPEVSIEQMIIDREITMVKAADNIDWLNAELKYKEDQLKNGIKEKNISELYKLVSFPLDDKKPRHVLKIEIGMTKRIIKAKEDSMKIMKELQIEDIKKLEENNATKSNKSKPTSN